VLTVEEARGNVERVDALWNEILEVQRALFLPHNLLFALVDQRLVDAGVHVPIAL